ncbi:hypothetical protein GQ44DRAFT_742363 [Phaeosphaeriaceae sp. PMI808]|nr:hypothetical protein GQ44DRAFT_742363 [Phaeosphaeriaceae sp. PMI808]
MQFTMILASAVVAFASGISAIPTSSAAQQITLRVFNDQTGINSDVSVPADNVPRYLLDLFKGTAIGNAGNVGTSAQLVKFSDTTKCTFSTTRTYDWIVEIDGRAKNFVDLDGDVTKAVPIWIGGFTFQCSQA